MRKLKTLNKNRSVDHCFLVQVTGFRVPGFEDFGRTPCRRVSFNIETRACEDQPQSMHVGRHEDFVGQQRDGRVDGPGDTTRE